MSKTLRRPWWTWRPYQWIPDDYEERLLKELENPTPLPEDALPSRVVRMTRFDLPED